MTFIATFLHDNAATPTICCTKGHSTIRAAGRCAKDSINEKDQGRLFISQRWLALRAIANAHPDLKPLGLGFVARRLRAKYDTFSKAQITKIAARFRDLPQNKEIVPANATCPKCGGVMIVSRTGANLICSNNTAASSYACKFVTAVFQKSGADAANAAPKTEAKPKPKRVKVAVEAAPKKTAKAKLDLSALGDLGAALYEAITGATAQKITESEAKVAERMAAIAKQVAEATKPKADHFKITIGDAPEIKIDGAVHPMFKRVLERFEVQKASGSKRLKPVLLVGPAGCGKSYLGEQVAQALDLPLYQQGLSGGIAESAFFGKLVPRGETGSFEFLSTPFLQAYENGGVFLLDELDAGDENVILALNNAIANGHAPVPNRAENPVAKRHKDFFLLANANTFGKGADRVYVGRNQLDGATLDRFQMGTFDMDYDRDLEATLCPDAALRDAWETIRKNVEKNRIRRVVSTRALVDAYDMRAGLNKTVKQCVEQLTTGWTQDEKRKAGVAETSATAAREGE